MRTVGFDTSLYILPFDHRGWFQTKLFGWKGVPSAEPFYARRLGVQKCAVFFVSDLALFGGRVGLRCPAVTSGQPPAHDHRNAKHAGSSHAEYARDGYGPHLAEVATLVA